MTAQWLRGVENAVVQRVAGAAQLFCLLDYDGTLAPLAPTPEMALPLPGTTELLQRLTAVPGIDVALVTGRTVADLRGFLDLPDAYYIGLHGMELRLPHGETRMSDSAAEVRTILPTLVRELRQAVGTLPGVLLEDKGAALACHYRLSGDADAAAVRRAVARLVREYEQRGVPIAVIYGHKVAEIRHAHINKGEAACALVANHAPAALPMYIGDDRTDEDAFRLLPADSITIRIAAATEPTLARYRASSPDDVQRLLRALLDRRLNTMKPGADA